MVVANSFVHCTRKYLLVVCYHFSEYSITNGCGWLSNSDLHRSIRARSKPNGGVAKELFTRVRSIYHPIGAKWVEDVLKA
jgi:hypothetical protein